MEHRRPRRGRLPRRHDYPCPHRRLTYVGYRVGEDRRRRGRCLRNAPTITNLDQLEAAYAQTEQLLQEAAEAAHTAFVAWQEAYGAYEVACDDAATARAHWAEAVSL